MPPFYFHTFSASHYLTGSRIWVRLVSRFGMPIATTFHKHGWSKSILPRAARATDTKYTVNTLFDELKKIKSDNILSAYALEVYQIMENLPNAIFQFQSVMWINLYNFAWQVIFIRINFKMISPGSSASLRVSTAISRVGVCIFGTPISEIERFFLFYFCQCRYA